MGKVTLESFKIEKVTVPEDFAIVELRLEEFKRLASEERFNPVFETSESFIHVDGSNRIMFYAKKET